MAGVTLVSHSEYEWKMQVDTTITPVGRVTAAVLDAGAVADIAIEDPPLEEVIARIYSEGGREESS
jgi:ABC-2 type transport system ATP-binding protein